MAAELGAHHALFQLPHRYSHGHLYHQQRGITEPVAAQDHQNPRRLPQRRSRTEVAVLGFAPSGEEVDDADSSLARGAEPLYDSVAGAHARPGKSGVMNHRLLHRGGEGRGAAPSLAHPSPKPKQISAVYTEKLTDLTAGVRSLYRIRAQAKERRARREFSIFVRARQQLAIELVSL